MLQDLHSHTYYSFCGKDAPEAIVEAAIAGGLQVFGITDHNYGMGFGRLDAFQHPSAPELSHDYGRTLRRYYDHLNLIREKYAGQIQVLRGIEISTANDPRYCLPENADISYFDYCLLEELDNPSSVTGGDLFAYAARCKCPAVGVAHTDMFAHIARLGRDPLDYFRQMAEQNIFWEMNVSYDSTHGYREHLYMLDFFADEEKQAIVRASGVCVSVGFDGHRVEDYLPQRVKDYCRRLEAMGIPMPFEALTTDQA